MHNFKQEFNILGQDALELVDVGRYLLTMQGHTYDGREVFYMRLKYMNSKLAGKNYERAIQWWAQIMEAS